MVATFKILQKGYVKDDGETVASTISLVLDEDVKLIVDPGMSKNRSGIIKELKDENLEPNDINYVFITHHHPDHTINIGMFPKATVIDFASTYKDDFWSEHEEDYKLTPNIKIVSTPGHTQEDASLVVRTDKGTIVFTHAWYHEDMTPEKDQLAEDEVLLGKSRKKILKIADFIVTSHGGLGKIK